MERPQIPENEKERLEILKSLNILESGPQDEFERVTLLAKKFFEVPIVLISLVDKERLWFKSIQGLDVEESGRDVSFCGHTILKDDMLCVQDTHQDDRFKDNPLVTGKLGVRFYAGVPFVVKDQVRVGTFCLLDTKPRQLSREEVALFLNLAKSIELELKVRLSKS